MPAAGVQSSQGDEAKVTDRSLSGPIPFLLGTACFVIIAWGIRAASDLLSLVLIGALLAYSALPFLKWMMHKFHLRKTTALSFAVGLMGSLCAVLMVLLYENVARVMEKLPTYQEHWHALYQQISAFLLSRGFDIASLSATHSSNSSEIVHFAQMILPGAGRIFMDGLLIVVLGAIFLERIVEDTHSANPESIVAQIRTDVAQYIAIAATTGVITALANLTLLIAIGVDFPLVWCVLYFFVQFIPNIGFILALVPPTCLTLLMLGWKKALLVGVGLLLTQLISDYVLTPLFLKKSVKFSFTEMVLSLLGWGFLLGPAGGILAIPLTLSLKRLIPELFKRKGSLAARSGRSAIANEA